MPDAPIAFFSYSREDSDFALRLANDLKASGSAVWIDQLDIGPGERWDRVVQQALENCPSVLIILSPASVNSNNVMDEVSFALDQQKAIIPVLYRDCDIPFRIRRFQHVDFRNNYEHMLEELKRCLHMATRPGEASAAEKPEHVESTPPPMPADRGPQMPAPAPPLPQHRAVEPEPPRLARSDTAPARTSGFPTWAKIAIPAAVVLILAIVLMNSGSKTTRQEANQPPSDIDKPGFGDLSRENRTATDSAGSTAAKVEVVRTALTTNESPPPCRFPESNGSPEFSVTDAKIWYAFEFRGGKPDDVWTVTWFRPNAGHNFVNYLTQTLKNTASGHGTYCYFINVAGTPVQKMTGYWSVELERNGEAVDSQEFLLTK